MQRMAWESGLRPTGSLSRWSTTFGRWNALARLTSVWRPGACSGSSFSGLERPSRLRATRMKAPTRADQLVQLGTRDLDVLVIGGGVDGLVAAASLAKAGKTVLLVERREALGGRAVTEPARGRRGSPERRDLKKMGIKRRGRSRR